MRILNPEEIRNLLEARPWLIMEHDRNMVVAKDQYQQDIKDFIEWGEETCYDHRDTYRLAEFGLKKNCSKCWQSLKQLVEE